MAEFYSARSGTIPPLPWQTFAPPFSPSPAVTHRANIDHIEDMVALALALGASRVEIAHVQYYGWALKNRGALMPSAAQVKRAAATVEELRRRHHGKIVIDAVVPDYYARLPKPCVGGWGRRSLNVTPAGKVLPWYRRSG